MQSRASLVSACQISSNPCASAYRAISSSVSIDALSWVYSAILVFTGDLLETVRYSIFPRTSASNAIFVTTA